jgi:hypothetical protein
VRWVGIIVGVILALVGATWLLQGIGMLPGSVMSGQTFWAGAGAVALFAGLVLLYLGLRGRRVASSV